MGSGPGLSHVSLSVASGALCAFWPGMVVAGAVFDVGVLAVAVLEHRDVIVGLVGEDRLEAARHDRWMRAVPGCGR